VVDSKPEVPSATIAVHPVAMVVLLTVPLTAELVVAALDEVIMVAQVHRIAMALWPLQWVVGTILVVAAHMMIETVDIVATVVEAMVTATDLVVEVAATWSR